MVSLIGVGDNTVDTYLQTHTRYPGGNAVNVAVLAQRLGARAAYLGSLGDHARGKLIYDLLTRRRDWIYRTAKSGRMSKMPGLG